MCVSVFPTFINDVANSTVREPFIVSGIEGLRMCRPGVVYMLEGGRGAGVGSWSYTPSLTLHLSLTPALWTTHVSILPPPLPSHNTHLPLLVKQLRHLQLPAWPTHPIIQPGPYTLVHTTSYILVRTPSYTLVHNTHHHQTPGGGDTILQGFGFIFKAAPTIRSLDPPPLAAHQPAHSFTAHQHPSSPGQTPPPISPTPGTIILTPAPAVPEAGHCCPYCPPPAGKSALLTLAR